MSNDRQARGGARPGNRDDLIRDCDDPLPLPEGPEGEGWGEGQQARHRHTPLTLDGSYRIAA
jgi:hypothetical protein